MGCTSFRIAKSCHQLNYILYYGRWKWVIWTAIFGIVSLFFIWNSNNMHLMKVLSQFFKSTWIQWSTHSTPFDWKNPIGYSIAFVWQYASIFVLLNFLATLTPLLLSLLIYANSLNKDWKHDLRLLKKMAKGEQSDVALSTELGEFIRSHAYMKELSESQTKAKASPSELVHFLLISVP